jgi:hypothetical protein
LTVFLFDAYIYIYIYIYIKATLSIVYIFLLLSLLDMRTTACMRLPVCGSTHTNGTACKLQPNESLWSPLLKVAFRLKNYCRAPLKVNEDELGDLCERFSCK